MEIQALGMNKLMIQLHPSLRISGIPSTFEGEFDDVTIIDAINELLQDYPDIHKLCIENGSNKPGLLFIAGQTELTSMGLLEEKLDEDLQIRIVPILHGG